MRTVPCPSLCRSVLGTEGHPWPHQPRTEEGQDEVCARPLSLLDRAKEQGSAGWKVALWAACSQGTELWKAGHHGGRASSPWGEAGVGQRDVVLWGVRASGGKKCY